MIDLYNLELEIGYGADREQIEMSRGEALELIVRLRQAEKDAARYRWLRDSEISASGGVAIEMDKKIDEAMQCNK